MAGRWRSQSYTAARANLDFNFRRRFLSGGIEGEQFWRQEGPSRLNLNGGARWSANERTEMALSLGYASSTAFERNRVIDLERQTSDLSSNSSLRGGWTGEPVGRGRAAAVDRQRRPHLQPALQPEREPVLADPGHHRSIGFNGTHTSQVFGDAVARRQPPQGTGQFGGSLGLSLGDFRVSTNASLLAQHVGTLAALSRDVLDTLTLQPTPRGWG